EQVARAALMADPGNPDAHAMLASMLFEREMLVPAAAHFERAIALAGRHYDLLLGLGRVLLRQGKLDAARPLLEAAAVANRNALEPAVYLAELEERLGRFEAAMQQLDRADNIAAAIGTDVKLQRSVLLERMGNIGAALGLLEGDGELSGAALLQRGGLRDRLGRHREAWRDWSAGKAMLAQRTGRHYPAAEVERQAEQLARFFDRSQMASLPRAARRTDVPQPIFVLGFPRSGTTLIEQILASHSAIRAGGELPFGRELRDFAVTLAGGEADFPASLGHDPQWPVQLRDFYLDKAEVFGLTAPGASFFTDKMPLNEMWLPLLRIAFPESPMVLVRRHPLDVLRSVMAHDMTHGFHCGYKLEDAARHLSLVDWLVAQYRAAGFEVTHELRYESMIGDQLGETERLMAAIGLPMESAQLHFHERTAVSPTPSYAQVREALNDRSIGRWRNYAAELEPVRPFVSDAMARGNYSA
ncbi:MAG TPA: sulfotransferase, partial [Sphingomicrobium sp.]|nr:sulfotransferase [Sphingomicrobium sp.]